MVSPEFILKLAPSITFFLPSELYLKLTFLNVAATSVPLVARLATEEGISANVISATTQKLSDEIYGSMLLGIPNSQFDKATAFLKNFENIKVEEVSADD